MTAPALAVLAALSQTPPAAPPYNAGGDIVVKYFFDGYCCSPGEIKDAALGPQHPSSLPFGDIVEGCQQLNPPFYTSANSTVLTKSVHRNISVFDNVAKIVSSAYASDDCDLNQTVPDASDPNSTWVPTLLGVSLVMDAIDCKPVTESYLDPDHVNGSSPKIHESVVVHATLTGPNMQFRGESCLSPGMPPSIPPPSMPPPSIPPQSPAPRGPPSPNSPPSAPPTEAHMPSIAAGIACGGLIILIIGIVLGRDLFGAAKLRELTPGFNPTSSSEVEVKVPAE